jgi:hydrogenase nickel incorporation protein HypB
MCVVCGCSGTPESEATRGAGPRIDPATGDLHYGLGVARVSVPGLSPERAIRLEADVLGENDRLAAANRAHFAAHDVLAYNLVSSPGSGKTTLLAATIHALRQRRPALPVAVIEGDQQTSHDAERIRATGAPAIQVNTGKGCHLDAQMVQAAFAQLHRPLPHGLHGHVHGHHSHDHDHDHGHAHHAQHAHRGPDGHADDHAHGTGGPSLLFIENVGNLVCPALWDLGERAKVAILSITEGEDKPLKYPDMFAAAPLMVLNKVDLLPHVDFDIERCIGYAQRVNPAIEVLLVSARNGTGLEAWLDWLLQPLPAAASAPHAAQRPPAVATCG